MTVQLLGNQLEFTTSDEVFSPSAVDGGTLAMLSKVTFSKGDKLLDLGCGYGVVGIAAAKILLPENVTMCDISAEAIRLASINAEANNVSAVNIVQSDGFANIADKNFTLILSNPPYHTDFSVAKSFIENGWKRLTFGGKMFMVTKRLDWYKNKLTAVFGGVKVYEINGYYVFESEKRLAKASNKKEDKKLSKKLQRKQSRSNQRKSSI